MRIAVSLLLLAVVAGAGDLAPRVDKLFHADPEVRAEARRQLLALEEDALAQVLARIEARAAKEAAEADAVLRFYDVRDLRTGDGAAWAATWARLRELDALIREQREGVLVVRAREEVHGRLAQVLVEARRAAAQVVGVTARIVPLRLGVACPARLAKDKLGPWVASLDGTPVELPAVTCRNGQTAEIVEMRSISYVADFTVEVAQGQIIADPAVRTVPKGIAIKLRPLVAGDGNSVELVLDVRFGDLKLPVEEKQVEVPEGRIVSIQVPEARSTRVLTARRLEPGDATVVDLGETPDGSRYALVLTATPGRLDD